MSAIAAIVGAGLVTSVGLTAPASCAAIRAKVGNPTQTRFICSTGDWLQAHQVPLQMPLRGRARLAEMAAMAIEECLAVLTRQDREGLPLLLCVAEQERPGRTQGLDQQLLPEIERRLRLEFSSRDSRVIAHGRASIGVALQCARNLLERPDIDTLVIAATDSLLTGPTLGIYDRDGRLLSAANSNGFIPGEGAGAVLVTKVPRQAALLCAGVGVATEEAHIDAELPMRADGLTSAIRGALQEAGREMHDVDFRVTDISGEHYYFREATLALSRILRVRKEEFDIWHPAECIGETGALAGVASVAVAHAACSKGYSRGTNILCHAGNDGGLRTAAFMVFQGS